MQAFTHKIVFDPKIRKLCSRPYQNHPKGCPNFGKRISCPPQSPLLNEVYDIFKGFWIVWNVFDFKNHVNKMQRAHPNWTRRQLECCLYWQGKARKQLKQKIDDAAYHLQGKDWWEVTTRPEAMGVNVTATMKNLGVELEWPPINYTYQVALFGVLKNCSDQGRANI